MWTASLVLLLLAEPGSQRPASWAPRALTGGGEAEASLALGRGSRAALAWASVALRPHQHGSLLPGTQWLWPWQRQRPALGLVVQPHQHFLGRQLLASSSAPRGSQPLLQLLRRSVVFPGNLGGHLAASWPGAAWQGGPSPPALEPFSQSGQIIQLTRVRQKRVPGRGVAGSSGRCASTDSSGTWAAAVRSSPCAPFRAVRLVAQRLVGQRQTGRLLLGVRFGCFGCRPGGAAGPGGGRPARGRLVMEAEGRLVDGAAGWAAARMVRLAAGGRRWAQWVRVEADSSRGGQQAPRSRLARLDSGGPRGWVGGWAGPFLLMHCGTGLPAVGKVGRG